MVAKSVNIMTLMATATKYTLSTVKLHLAMEDPHVVGLNSDWSNIKCSVMPSSNVNELTTIIADELTSVCLKMPKTVICCQILYDCAEIFSLIKTKLGPRITKPPGLPDIPE